MEIEGLLKRRGLSVVMDHPTYQAGPRTMSPAQSLAILYIYKYIYKMATLRCQGGNKGKEKKEADSSGPFMPDRKFGEGTSVRVDHGGCGYMNTRLQRWGWLSGGIA